VRKSKRRRATKGKEKRGKKKFLQGGGQNVTHVLNQTGTGVTMPFQKKKTKTITTVGAPSQSRNSKKKETL